MRIQTKCVVLLLLLTTGYAAICAAADAAPPKARAAAGAIVGIIANGSKAPIGGATITAVREDGGAIRATVSTSDGVYSFSDLAPGTWIVTAQVDGYPDVTLPPVMVLASKAARSDMVMDVPAIVSSPLAPALASAKAPPEPAASAAAESTLIEKIKSIVPLALQAPPPPATDANGVDNFTPFAFGDFTWLNGSPRNKAPVFDTNFFTPDIRLDAHYMQDFNGPKDHTIVGSTESFRAGEFQVEQISLGGDFHYDNVRARVLTMAGLFATTTPRNDASSAVGQWDLPDAYRYVSEANAGYHFDVNHGLNVDVGIFVSYIGLFSYYNYDNWTYQPSYVSSNTPWFFNGMRIQWFPTNKLKIEPWIINGWQSYARFNGHLGYGGQILYEPNENLKLVFNNYGVGTDNLGLPHTTRYHTDDSIEYKYYSNPGALGISKAAFSFTGDLGCQSGGGIHCTKEPNKSAFAGWMLYNRVWFHNDLFALTLGGGAMWNPGLYLTLLPPINGATAATGTPYFTENPGQLIYQWDTTLNFQYMPKQWLTWWTEFGYRHSSVPYFAGQGGVTPPGGNNGSPQNYTCNNGASAGTNDLGQATSACGNSGVWQPDLRVRQTVLSFGVLVKF
jgi:hypothetical protein